MKVKRYGNYQSGIKKRYRIVAIILCAVLVLTAVGIGIMITTSNSNADTSVSGRDRRAPFNVASAISAMTISGGDEDRGSTGDGNTDGDQTNPGDTNDDTGGDTGIDPGAYEPDPEKDPATIEITKYPDRMSVGASYTIGYILKNTGGNTNVKWASGDTDVATVDSDGTVRAIASGKVEITAELGKAKASVVITVTEKVIKPKSFKVEIKEFTAGDIVVAHHSLTIGGILHAVAVVEPAGAMLEGKFLWEADKSGLISMKESGDANQNAALTGLSHGEVALTIRYGGSDAEMDDVTINFTIPTEKPPIDTFFFAIFGGIIAIIIIVLIVLIAGRARRRRSDERRALPAQKRRTAPRRTNADQAEQGRRANEASSRGHRDATPRHAPVPRGNSGYEQGYTKHGQDDVYGGAERPSSRGTAGQGSGGGYSGDNSRRSSGSENKRRARDGRNSGSTPGRSSRRGAGGSRRGADSGNQNDRYAGGMEDLYPYQDGAGQGYADGDTGYRDAPKKGYAGRGKGGGHSGGGAGLTGRTTRVYDAPPLRRPPLSSGYGENPPVKKPQGKVPSGKPEGSSKRFSIDDID